MSAEKLASNSDCPLVSIIIPMYNAERFVGECIDSVLKQDYRNWELLIVDNCSTDNSRNIVSEYSEKNNKIKLIKCDSNSGSPARPRNIGMKCAQGKYIAFLDADDLWLKEKLTRQVDYLEKNEDVYFLYARFLVWKRGKILKNIFPNENQMKSGRIFNSLFLCNFIPCLTVIFRNKYDENYLFDEDPESIEDCDLWLRISRDENVAFIKEPVAIYRLHGASSSSSIKRHISRNLKLLKKWRGKVNPLLIAVKYLQFFYYICLWSLRKLKDKVLKT